MFSSLSSNLWKNTIHAIIVLDNEHRFKEDPDYSHMLKRMWNGDLTTEDQKRINTRVIGYKGLKLPTMLEGMCTIILFNKIIFDLNLTLSLKSL
jgi:hypothetical protein